MGEGVDEPPVGWFSPSLVKVSRTLHTSPESPGAPAQARRSGSTVAPSWSRGPRKRIRAIRGAPARANLGVPVSTSMASTQEDPVWWRPFASAGIATVTYVDLSPDSECEAVALEWLDNSERARRRRFRHAGARRRFVLCRAALRAMLRERLGCGNDQLSFDSSQRGKPFALVDGVLAPVSFSVSHSGRHGLIAVAPTGRVGIDVEDRAARADMDAVAAMTFAPVERAELAAASGGRRTDLFFTVWTTKEAIVKALGVGLSRDLRRLEIPRAMRRGAKQAVLRLPDLPTEIWQLENLGSPEFAAAIATELNSD